MGTSENKLAISTWGQLHVVLASRHTEGPQQKPVAPFSGGPRSSGLPPGGS
jgi:hypothetical protein